MTGLKVNGVSKMNQSSPVTTLNSDSINANDSVHKFNSFPTENGSHLVSQLSNSAVMPEVSDKKTSFSEEKEMKTYKESSSQQSSSKNPTLAGSTDKDVATGTEIGLMFVKQYYALMNFSPKYLHCFYKKSSTMIHGLENQEVKPQVGQQYDFKNCKVVVSNVDCQASLFGSYVIVVLGILSNNNEPPKRFSQTFVLCKQDTGFYILNDIFRFLKDELESKEQDVDLVEVKIEDGEFKVVDVKDSQTVNGSQNPCILETPESTNLNSNAVVDKSTTTDSNASCIETPEKDSNVVANSKTKKEINKVKPHKVSSENSSSKTKTNLNSGSSPNISTENATVYSSASAHDKSSKNNATRDSSKTLDNSTDKKSNLEENKNSNSSGRNGSTNSRRDTPDYSSSLCVKFTKEGTSEADIISVFEVFGKVRSVEFRNQVVFVNFESADSRTKALNHGKIFICDESVKVEPRRQLSNSNRNSQNRGPFRGTRSRSSNQKTSSPST